MCTNQGMKAYMNELQRRKRARGARPPGRRAIGVHGAAARRNGVRVADAERARVILIHREARARRHL